jgi:hypothetical protein
VLLADPTSLALGDLDADGWPEIAGVDSMGHVLVFDHDGNRLAAAPGVAPTSMGSFFVDGEPLIADVDGVPPAEIVFAGQVLRYHSGNAQLEVVWQQPVAHRSWPISMAMACSK